MIDLNADWNSIVRRIYRMARLLVAADFLDDVVREERGDAAEAGARVRLRGGGESEGRRRRPGRATSLRPCAAIVARCWGAGAGASPRPGLPPPCQAGAGPYSGPCDLPRIRASNRVCGRVKGTWSVSGLMTGSEFRRSAPRLAHVLLSPASRGHQQKRRTLPTGTALDR